MSQSSYSFSPTITRADYSAFVSGLFAAIQSGNSGATAPTDTAAGMVWIDTSAAEIVVRQRNKANTAWLAIWPPSAVAFNPTGTDLVATNIDAALREINLKAAGFTIDRTTPSATVTAASLGYFSGADVTLYSWVIPSVKLLAGVDATFRIQVGSITSLTASFGVKVDGFPIGNTVSASFSSDGQISASLNVKAAAGGIASAAEEITVAIYCVSTGGRSLRVYDATLSAVCAAA